MVESAVNSGYRVIALDAFADRDTQTLTNAYSLIRDFHAPYSPEALLDACRHFAFDAITYTANLENHPGVLESISQGHTIIGNTPSSIRAVRSWKELFADLQGAGFFVPEIVLASDTFRIDSSRRWLVKPLLSGGGHGIQFLRDENTPESHYFLLRVFNALTGAIALRILAVYFEVFHSLLSTGLGLITGGALTLLLAWLWRSRALSLSRRLSGPPGPGPNAAGGAHA